MAVYRWDILPSDGDVWLSDMAVSDKDLGLGAFDSEFRIRVLLCHIAIC